MITKSTVIQLFLPEGINSNLRIAEIKNGKGEMTVIPRIKIKELDKWKKYLGVGVYFLIGLDENTDEKLVYVGEAEDCFTRLKQHNQSKDFWNIALVFTIGNELTRLDIKYLEWLSYIEVEKIKRYNLENNVIPSEPKNIKDPQEVILKDYFTFIKILTSTLGYPLFEKIKQKKAEVFVCKSKWSFAKGQFTEEGFVVFKGSKCRIDTIERCMKSVINRRENLLKIGILKDKGDHMIFQKDFLFDKPSQASSVVLGMHSNGWIEWKRESDNKTLDEIFRK